MNQLVLTIPETMSLVGLIQSVYIVVYMMFRSGDIRRALLPLIYFVVLGAAFFLDFAVMRVGEVSPLFAVAQWAAWFMGPPLSVLLIMQVVRITKAPASPAFLILLLVPLAHAVALSLARHYGRCGGRIAACGDFHDFLTITGLIAGAISIMAIWTQRGAMEEMRTQKVARDRYWLILMLVFTNLSFLGIMLFSLTPLLNIQTALMIRTILGLGLVYLGSTSLFRIYPQALVLIERRARAAANFQDADRALIQKIENLLNLEKVYHESSYGRADLARELQIPEAVLSKIINVHFGKSFPQLVNERRIEDAKRLLVETNAPVNVIAGEVGFNSIASFNRVFRDLTGMTATDYRSVNQSAPPVTLIGG